MPVPTQVWLTEGSLHESKAVKGQSPELRAATLFGDLAYLDKEIVDFFKDQQTQLITPCKKAKGKDLTETEKYHNRLVSHFRQPIESLFNWIIEKTGIQKTSKVRSTDGLMIHCWENSLLLLSSGFQLLIRILIS